MNEKKALSGFPPTELAEILSFLPKFRAKQIFKWIARGAESFDAMSDLSLNLREDLAGRFSVRSTTIVDRLDDEDGTSKLQIRLEDGALIEAVILIDGEGRKTACLSTQVGCPMRCAFCKTGSLGFLRNLSSAEIVDQFLHMRTVAGDLSNIVVMGMGEPLLNLPALRSAVEIFTHPDGLGLSRRRITVSTSGVVSGIRSLTEDGPDVRLALSLTTADEALRERIMPITKTDPLGEVKAALIDYQKRYDKRITLEAVLLGGINTRREDAQAMVEFARGLDAAINLIPWNPVDGMGLDGVPFREPTAEEIDRFALFLEDRGLNVTRRYRKGRGVSGACGQLGSVETFQKDEIQRSAD